MNIKLHDLPVTSAPWEVRPNDPRLCVRGTEHLFSVVTVERVDRSLVIRAVAENMTEADAVFVATARNRPHQLPPDDTLIMIAERLRALMDSGDLEGKSWTEYTQLCAAIDSH